MRPIELTKTGASDIAIIKVQNFDKCCQIYDNLRDSPDQLVVSKQLILINESYAHTA